MKFVLVYLLIGSISTLTTLTLSLFSRRTSNRRIQTALWAGLLWPAVWPMVLYYVFKAGGRKDDI